MKKPQSATIHPPDISGHYCPVCGKFGGFGFGPPGWPAPTRWFCREHKSHAGPPADLVDKAAATASPKKSPVQGSLL